MTHVCSICGSNDITLIDDKAQKYRCNSCDNVFDISIKPKYVAKEKANTETVLSVKDIYKNNIDSIFEINCMFGETASCGTCFCISSSGYLLTNAHVLWEVGNNGKPVLCNEVYICKNHSTEYTQLQIVYIDHKNDLALLKSPRATFKPTTFAKTELEVGDFVCAVGNSKGDGLALVDGIVSDLNREFGGHSAFLFNALVTNGCSGGPIFNDKGEVCGVTVGQVKDVAGMNYGIPLSVVKSFIAKSKKGIIF